MQYRIRVETPQNVWWSNPQDLNEEQIGQFVDRLDGANVLVIDSGEDIICFMSGVLSEAVITVEKEGGYNIRDEMKKIKDALRPLYGGVRFREGVDGTPGDTPVTIAVQEINGPVMHMSLSNLRQIWEVIDKLDGIL